MCEKVKSFTGEVDVVSDEQARETFMLAIKKIEHIRNISSPILKVITLSRCMDDIMGLMGEAGEISDADVLFNMIFFILLKLQSDDCPFLGARFIEECSYIDAFLHED